MRSRGVRALAAALLAIVPAAGWAGEVVVSAAASLTDALTEIGAAYTRANPGTVVRFNFGASGALMQQILQGAPVDAFAPASRREMDTLQQAHRVEPATRIDFASNRLVLVAPAGSRLRNWDGLRQRTVRRVAISNPAYVPSGRYAQQTLTARGLWPIVQPRAVLGENVRQTLTYVAAGDVDAGIVFATDARAEAARVRVAGYAIPGRDHEPIVYPAAVVRGAPNSASARRVVAYLRSAVAQAILRRHGFRPAPAAASR